MKIGILFGTSAGSGGWTRAETLLAERLRGHEAAVCLGPFGGSGTRESWTVLNSGAGSGYVENLAASVGAMATWGAELLLCVGGDGLASYAADAMLSGDRPMVMAGIAAGTINVGPIVSIGMDVLPDFDPERLFRSKVGAVEVLAEGRHLAYGFNDIVLGDTFLGTLGEEVVAFSADALLERGEKIATEPSGIVAGLGFRVLKNDKPVTSRIGCPAQIIVAPLRAREFFARSIAGILCEAPYLKGAAALALFDSVIVKAGSPAKGWKDFSCSEQLLFGPEDSVELEGFASRTRIIVDGNPFAPKADRLEFKSLPDLIEVAGILPAKAGG
ncbi:MAG: hypothetical protein NT061_01665 [Spirochaetes bacterium]|nr:hypothetical protein [Spirochaetota bacterium]